MVDQLSPDLRKILVAKQHTPEVVAKASVTQRKAVLERQRLAEMTVAEIEERTARRKEEIHLKLQADRLFDYDESIKLRDIAKSYTPLCLDVLAEIAVDGKNESSRVAAAMALLDRGWGKARPVASDPEPESNTHISVSFPVINNTPVAQKANVIEDESKDIDVDQDSE